MCGIVGYVGKKDALRVILSGLNKLSYRGYDSAGVSIFEDGKINTTRALGKLSELEKLFQGRKQEQIATLGIGHTRWATHGRPSEQNAHPHTAGRVSIIHNGIIENYAQLKSELKANGVVFLSETDTEIAAHLLDQELNKGVEPFLALKNVCKKLKGSYAFVAIDSKNPDRLLVAKNATPIVIGVAQDEVIVASDIPAVLDYTRNLIVLEDGDFAEIYADKINIEHAGVPVNRKIQYISWDAVTAQKGGFKHFMLKEIHDQSQAVNETFRGRIDLENSTVVLPEIKYSDAALAKFRRVIIVACGTAWHAGLVAKYYFEEIAGISCEVDYASEFRYRQAPLDQETLVLAVSQSGETADTLAAIERAVNFSHVAAVCNVLGSTLARKVNNTLFTHAGPEISVASTKAFTTQLIALLLLAIRMAKARSSSTDIRTLSDALLHLPQAITNSLLVEAQVKELAKKIHKARDFLFLGRGICYPVALEGALKLKEISYIHAEGYPAGEMKHGPIALIDENVPVVVVLQRSKLQYEKAFSNLREAQSRAGRIIAITDLEDGVDTAMQELRQLSEFVITVPFLHDYLSPLLLTLPLQLLAYHIAVINGTDVDLPRNLAKSVTVE